jgi:NADH-quinone oxidoreductase subunit G
LLGDVAPEGLAIVLSAQHSNEDNFAFAKVARDVLGASKFFVGGKPLGEGDQVLREADKNPNTRGATALAGSSPGSMKDLGDAIAGGNITAVFALGSELRDLEGSVLGRVAVSVVLATHVGPLAERASVLLPTSSFAESDGTFVNSKGMAQDSEQALGPLGDSRPAWKLAAAVAARLGRDFGWRKLADVQKAMGPDGGVVSERGSAQAGAAS